MQYRRLGRTGLDVSVIGLGGLYFPAISNVAAVKAIMRASELGINLVEVGRAYVGSEEKAGFVMQKNRDLFYIASKTPGREKEDVARDIEASLAALKTDRIDIYQIHQVDSQEELDMVLKPGGACDGLKCAREQGKIRYTGITGHSAAVLARAIKTGEFDTVQVLFNPVEREAIDELVSLAADMDIGVMGMKPFGGGAFLEKRSAIYRIMEKYHTPAIHAFLRFELSFSISSMLTGIRTIEELEENAALGSSFRPFSRIDIDSIVRDIKSLSLKGKNSCHRCGYCLPCPMHIDIPLILRLYEYLEEYKSTDWPTRMYRYHPPGALACVKCGKCEKRCPFGLPIREMLMDAHKKLAPG